jgi:SsrA-binding protein
MKENKFKTKIEINNRKARFEYTFLETEVAGIVLQGTEIKSIREGKASLVDSYCYIDNNGELWLKNAHIAKYTEGTYTNHEERRERKLLLTRKQLRKFSEEAKKPGQTIVPIKLFIDDNTKGKCKVLIALARGKREFDKRQSIKENEAKREMSRAIKNF